jgi:undecaprenyl-diphosphatase
MARVKTSVATLARLAHDEVSVIVGLLFSAALLLGFGKLAAEVIEGDTAAFDRAVLLLFRHANDLSMPLGPPWFQEMARDVTALGSFALLTFLTLGIFGYLLIIRKKGAALFLLASVLGGTAISSLLKILFERARPDIVPQATRVFTASFPSGHALLSAVVYLTIASLLVRIHSDRTVRLYILLVAVFLTIMVGISRVYLGVHWPTDVVAGWCVGAAWAILCWTLIVRLQKTGTVEGSQRQLPSV